MWQVIGHERPMHRLFYLPAKVGTILHVVMGAVNPERDVVLRYDHLWGKLQVAAIILATVVDQFAVVRHIDDNGVLLLESPDDGIHHGIVVAYGIVVAGQHPLLFFIEVGPFVVIGIEDGVIVGVSLLIVGMQAHEMEDDKPGNGGGRIASVEIVANQVHVIGMTLHIPFVEEVRVQLFVVHEHILREIAEGRFLVERELVAEEVHLISSLLENCRHYRIIIP